MAANGRPTFAKRQREQKRDRKKKDKALERERRKARSRDSSDNNPDGVDPDIAHIKPGPQPLPWDEDEPDYSGVT